MHPKVDGIVASRRPDLIAGVRDGHGVRGLSVGPARRCVANGITCRPVCQRDVHVSELSEPELLFFDQLVLEHQAAGVTARWGDREGKGDARAWGNISRQNEALVRVPAVIAKATSRIGEMHAKMHRGTAGGRPDLIAGIRDSYRISLALTTSPVARSVGYCIARTPLSRDRGVHVGKLGEPELLLFDHLVLEHQAAAVDARGGDRD